MDETVEDMRRVVCRPVVINVDLVPDAQRVKGPAPALDNRTNTRLFVVNGHHHNEFEFFHNHTPISSIVSSLPGTPSHADAGGLHPRNSRPHQPYRQYQNTYTSPTVRRTRCAHSAGFFPDMLQAALHSVVY